MPLVGIGGDLFRSADGGFCRDPGGVPLNALGGTTTQLVQRFDRTGELAVALVLSGLGLVKARLRLISSVRKPFNLLAMIFDHLERAPLGGVEIVDHAVPHHRVEPETRERTKSLRFLAPQSRCFVHRRAQCIVEATLVATRAANRVLDREQSITATERHILTNG